MKGQERNGLRMGKRVEERLWIEKPNTMPLEVEHCHGMARAKLGSMSS